MGGRPRMENILPDEYPMHPRTSLLSSGKHGPRPSRREVFEGDSQLSVIGDIPELNLRVVIYATDFSLCFQNAGHYAALFGAVLLGEAFCNARFHSFAGCNGGGSGREAGKPAEEGAAVPSRRGGLSTGVRLHRHNPDASRWNAPRSRAT